MSRQPRRETFLIFFAVFFVIGMAFNIAAGQGPFHYVTTLADQVDDPDSRSNLSYATEPVVRAAVQWVVLGAGILFVAGVARRWHGRDGGGGEA